MLCCWWIFCMHIVMHIVLHGFKFVICIFVSLVFGWISFLMFYHGSFSCAVLCQLFYVFFMPMCCWLLSYHMFIHFILLVRCYHACYMPLDLCVYIFFAVCLFFKICLLWFMSYCVTGANTSSLPPLHPRKLADITAGKAFGIFWLCLRLF